MTLAPESTPADLPDARVATDHEGRVLAWDAGAEAQFGHATAEALGCDIDALLTPLRGAGDDEHPPLAQALVADEVLERTCRRKDGGLIQVELRREPGAPSRHVLHSRDVTRRKTAQDGARAASRYRPLLDAMPDGIVMVNALGRIVLANAQAEHLFGYGTEELVGLPVEALLPSRYREAHLGHRAQFHVQPRVRRMGVGLELNGQRKSGEEFPVEISLSPLATSEGMLISAAVRDISDRRRIERALRDKNLELAAAILARDRFLASMSHELRTPLNPVIGFTGTLLMRLPGPLTEDQTRQLEVVQGSARHLLALINDLLDLARIEADKVEVHVEPVELAVMLNEVAAPLRVAAEDKGLALTTELESPLRTLATDRRILKQILLNLVGNAVKFTDTGEVRLRAARRPDAARVIFEVRDTGIGIPADRLPMLFEAFSRIVEPGAPPREGTGLGLHVSRKLAATLGGEIACASSPGEGSTFSLELPLR